MNSRQYANEVVHKKGRNSKKWIMTLVGLGCVMFSFIAGLVVIYIHPDKEASTAVVGLVTQVVTFLGAVVGAYTTGQSFVDWKAQSSLTAMVSSETKHLVTDITEKHIDVSSRAKDNDYEAQ